MTASNWPSCVGWNVTYTVCDCCGRSVPRAGRAAKLAVLAIVHGSVVRPRFRSVTRMSRRSYSAQLPKWSCAGSTSTHGADTRPTTGSSRLCLISGASTLTRSAYGRSFTSCAICACTCAASASPPPAAVGASLPSAGTLVASATAPAAAAPRVGPRKPRSCSGCVGANVNSTVCVAYGAITPSVGLHRSRRRRFPLLLHLHARDDGRRRAVVVAAVAARGGRRLDGRLRGRGHLARDVVEQALVDLPAQLVRHRVRPVVDERRAQRARLAVEQLAEVDRAAHAVDRADLSGRGREEGRAGAAGGGRGERAPYLDTESVGERDERASARAGRGAARLLGLAELSGDVTLRLLDDLRGDVERAAPLAEFVGVERPSRNGPSSVGSMRRSRARPPAGRARPRRPRRARRRRAAAARAACCPRRRGRRRASRSAGGRPAAARACPPAAVPTFDTTSSRTTRVFTTSPKSRWSATRTSAVGRTRAAARR